MNGHGPFCAWCWLGLVTLQRRGVISWALSRGSVTQRGAWEFSLVSLRKSDPKIWRCQAWKINGETEVLEGFGRSQGDVGRAGMVSPCSVSFPSLRGSSAPGFYSLAWLGMGPVPPQPPPARGIGHAASPALGIAAGSLRRSLGEKRQLSGHVKYVGCNYFPEELAENRRNQHPAGWRDWVCASFPLRGGRRRGTGVGERGCP